MSKGTIAHGIILGRLGKDPESFSFGGKTGCTLSLATTSGFGDRETTSWWTVKIFDERKAKTAMDYLTKGKRCHCTGELVVNKWTNREGATVYSTELHLGFSGTLDLVEAKEDSSGGGYNREDRKEPAPKPSNKTAFVDDLDDDVPF